MDHGPHGGHVLVLCESSNQWNSTSVGFAEKWVRTNDMHCTCARCMCLQLLGLFLSGTHSAKASQVYMLYEALICGPSVCPLPQKNWVFEPAVECNHSPQNTGIYRPNA